MQTFCGPKVIRGGRPPAHRVLATVSRGFMNGSADMGDIAIVLGTAALLTAIFAPLTTHLYRTRS